MEQTGTNNMCRNVCWIIGIIAGVIAFWVAKVPVSFIAAVLLGVAVAALLGLILNSLFCKAAPVAPSITSESARNLDADNAAALAKAKSDTAKAEADAMAQAQADAKAKAEADAQAAAQLKADLDAKAAKEIKEAAAAKVAADKAAAEKPAPKPAAKPVAKSKKSKVTAKAEPASGGNAVAPRKPEGLSAARGGKADDLKQIKGIGPKLESLCNEMGFYHFDQIASWGADEVAYMNENLKGFKGRVSRDTWVEQAVLLASGEATEFSKRVEKGNVYNK